MITLSDVCDWIESLEIADNHYISNLDTDKDKSIGIYDRQSNGAEEIAIGGYSNTKTLTKRVNILIHWNNKADETEEAANDLIEAIHTANTNRDVVIGNHQVCYLKLMTDGSVDVGISGDVYERSIWLDIIYQK